MSCWQSCNRHKYILQSLFTKQYIPDIEFEYKVLIKEYERDREELRIFSSKNCEITLKDIKLKEFFCGIATIMPGTYSVE